MASDAVVQQCPVDDCAAAQRTLAELLTWRDDADVAAAAYGRPPPEVIGNKHLVTDPAELARAGLETEDLTIPGTNFGAVVYRQGEPPSYTVGFRGTEEWLGSDMKANVDQAFDRRTNGAPTSYYSRAQQIASQMEIVQKRNGGEPTKFVGHSLGGGLASAAAASVGGRATTFNAAGLNPATVTNGRSGGEVEALHVKGEALTSLQQLPRLAEAYGTRSVPLDPPFHLARDLLIPIVGAMLGGPLGIGGAIALRSGLLHKMGNVIESMDNAIEDAKDDVESKCQGGSGEW